jgi:hypothetical protein
LKNAWIFTSKRFFVLNKMLNLMLIAEMIKLLFYFFSTLSELLSLIGTLFLFVFKK